MSTRTMGGIALVTGAAGGIGAATTQLLRERGCTVYATDMSAEAVATAIERHPVAGGGRVVPLAMDVRSVVDIMAVRGEIEKAEGRLDYLVNNAGIVTMHDTFELAEEDWDRVVDVNLKGPWLVSKTLADLLSRSESPAIVNLSTIESEVVVTSGSSSQPHYNGSKGGVRMLTKALAVDLASRKIRVNAVAPGPVATDFVSLETVTSAEAMEFFGQRLLIDRVAQPLEIARAIAFLLSTEASYITGTQLTVDGGWLAR